MAEQITTWVGDGIAQSNKSKPLVILLHGYGANEVDLPDIMNDLPKGLAWVSPRAPITLGGNAFAWFPITLPLNPDAQTTQYATERLWSWIDATVPATTPLIVIGFSQGAFMASQLLRTRPNRILKTAIIAGFVSGHSQPGDADLNQRQPHVFYSRGLNDTVVSEVAVQRIKEWLRNHTNAEGIEVANLGHGINQQTLKALASYLAA